ncbi:MAG: 1-deoxy-D-xylulose-5-phosphate reductoisomerase [Chromatiales bacterium]|nr:1-deoxy-D-xylulose-5-phosphate reductoisomerase [Chromatiales bacterium]
MSSGSNKIIVLGSTGSIGAHALDVIRSSSNLYKVFALTAYNSAEKLAKQCAEFKPRYAVLSDANQLIELQALLQKYKLNTQALPATMLTELIAEADYDTVVTGISGMAGLSPILAAAQAGKRILFANKEALVAAGDLLMKTVEQHSAELLPIDSEHNAIFQCLGGSSQIGIDVRNITLTASGGPLFTWPLGKLHLATPEQACTHPNWDMGAKISVDSATLMNKGLEVIEARWLFGIELSRIKVLIHPQSIVHGLVEMKDGSIIAQLSKPDMRIPIAYSLAWPKRLAAGKQVYLDLEQCSKLEFYPVDSKRFPCLSLAYQAMKTGASAPAVLNAANEEAVHAFLDGRITFDNIAEICAGVMEQSKFENTDSLEHILEVDSRSRRIAQSLINIDKSNVVSFPNKSNPRYAAKF